MKIKKSKKGFTLTELAIVIAVIAILIAVLVPTFISLINKANNSSDEQTVKNMNTALQIDEADNDQPEYLCQVWKILENAGYNPAPTPDYTDNEFYWYKTDNVILIYSTSEEQFTFPSDYAGTNLSTASTVVNVASTTVTAAKTAITSWTNLVKLDTNADSDDAHNFDNGEITQEGSCTVDEITTYTCAACDGTKTEVVEAVGHSYDDGETTDYVTAEKVVYTDGTKKTCTVCGEIELSGGTEDTSGTYSFEIDGEDIILTGVSEDFMWDNTETSITIPYGVTKINEKAFNNEDGYTGLGKITSVEFPDTLTTIGDYAFYHCFATSGSSTELVIPASVTYIGKYAFTTEGANSYIKSITFEAGSQLQTIGDNAFYQLTRLESITLPDSLETIGKNAFHSCSLITNIVIPDNVTSIGDRTFYGCSKLETVVIGESVKNIGLWAFYNTALTSVTFKNTSGWYVTANSDLTGGTDISVGLSDTSTAATYLKSTYSSSELYWYRSDD